MNRAPTDQEFETFKGAHCGTKWKQLPPGWTCPGCRRNKRQLMKWIARDARWSVHLHHHHCHGTERLRHTKSGRPFYMLPDWLTSFAEFERGCRMMDRTMTPATIRNAWKFVRFPSAIICGDCNSADGAAKRRLGLDPCFSFSPEEIAQFVTAVPNGKVTINYANAAYQHAQWVIANDPEYDD